MGLQNTTRKGLFFKVYMNAHKAQVFGFSKSHKLGFFGFFVLVFKVCMNIIRACLKEEF
jgi:hypothetical protein